MSSRRFVLFFAAIFSSFFAINTQAGVSDFSNVEIEDDFLPYLAAQKRFMQYGGIKEFKIPGEESRVIVCVVSVPSKGFSARAVSNMIKVCRIKAQVELLKVQQVEVSTVTKIEDRVVSVSDGKKETVKSISDYLNVVKEKAYGVVKAMPVIGTWYSKDKKEFFLAVGKIID